MIEWKNIPNYEGIYEASTDGRIRSVDGKTTFTVWHGIRHWEQRELSQGWHKSGYMVTLYKDGKPNKQLVARLIATTFLENLINTEMTVNHIDGNRRNNHISNLEWLTRADNIKHGFDTGLYSCKKPISISSENHEVKLFTSMAETSRYLGRDSRYISAQLKNKRAIYSIDGTEYLIN